MNNTNNILVTGAAGQLGQELQKLAIDFPDYSFIFADRSLLPIEDEKKVEGFFKENKINHCINAAAYTAVDMAETEYHHAELINGKAVGYLAEAAKKFGSSFIHISTDYVFDGTGEKPYKPHDEVSPVNAYGRSKLLGEKEAGLHNLNAIIIRTSWLYSSFGKNFVKTMKSLMESKTEINVVADQVGSPTYAADLAEAIMQIINSGKALIDGGIYHFSNTGIISWFDFASEIQTRLKLNCKVNPIPTTSFPTPAARPKYSVLDNQKMMETFGVESKDWRQSLEQCLILLR